MNKKLIIGALVASIIIFLWQFLAWSVINIHQGQMSYTPKQEKIMEFLDNNLDEGTYFLPTAPADAPQEEHQKVMEDGIGKSWAQISYHKNMKMTMGMNMFRGWSVDFIASLLLCWFLLKISNLNFSTTLLTSLAVGFIGFLTINYPQSIWFEDKVVSHLIHAIVQWGLVGVWLGWWLNRK